MGIGHWTSGTASNNATIREHLAAMELPTGAAEHVASLIEKHGNVLEQLGVPAHGRRLLTNLRFFVFVPPILAHNSLPESRCHYDRGLQREVERDRLLTQMSWPPGCGSYLSANLWSAGMFGRRVLRMRTYTIHPVSRTFS